MTATQRRFEILELIMHRRKEQINNLAVEFGVTPRTIQRDLAVLTLSYPIETMQGHGGCVRAHSDLPIERMHLRPEESALLKRLAESLTPRDKKIMDGIISAFGI